MEVHKFDNFEPNSARYSIKFLLASSSNEDYERAALVLFSSVLHQHSDVRRKLAEILGIDTPVILTAGVFTRKNETDPYSVSLGSDSLDKEGVFYKGAIPEDIRLKITGLINEMVGTAPNSGI